MDQICHGDRTGWHLQLSAASTCVRTVHNVSATSIKCDKFQLSSGHFLTQHSKKHRAGNRYMSHAREHDVDRLLRENRMIFLYIFYSRKAASILSLFLYKCIVFCMLFPISNNFHLLQRILYSFQFNDTGIYTEKRGKYKCLILIFRWDSFTVSRAAYSSPWLVVGVGATTKMCQCYRNTSDVIGQLGSYQVKY